MVLLQFAVTAYLALCGALAVDRPFQRRNTDRIRWLERLAMLGVGAMASSLGLLLARGL